MTENSDATKTVPSRKRDLPATVGFVEEVRDELKAEVRALEHGMNAQFKDVYARFDVQDKKFDQMLAAVHRSQALLEQQHAENRIILEKLSSLNERQDRLEARQDRNDELMLHLARLAPRPAQ